MLVCRGAGRDRAAAHIAIRARSDRCHLRHIRL